LQSTLVRHKVSKIFRFWRGGPRKTLKSPAGQRKKTQRGTRFSINSRRPAQTPQTFNFYLRAD